MQLRTCLLVGVIVQVLLLGIAHQGDGRPLQGDENHYHYSAVAQAAGREVGPFLLFPPGYSWFLSGIYALAGPHRIAAELAQAALFLGAAALLHRLLLRAGLDPRGAGAATLLFLADPQLAAFAGYLWPEAVHLVLMLATVLLLTQGRAHSAFAGGVALGLALVTKSLLGPFAPVLFAVAALSGPREAAIRRAALAVAGVALVVGPVVLDQGLRYHYWGVANSGPYNVWVGLNDPPTRREYDSVVVPAGAMYMELSRDHAERNRLMWERVRAKVESDGVFATLTRQIAKQYGRLFDRESFFTDQLAGGRMRRDHYPRPLDDALRFWAYAAYAVTLVLTALGFAAWDWRARWRAALLPALFLAYNVSLFLLLHVVTRYRVAILPAAFFFAAAGVDALPRISWRGLATGAALAGLLLMLAFGGACPAR
jgi:hypothetical protein